MESECASSAKTTTESECASSAKAATAKAASAEAASAKAASAKADFVNVVASMANRLCDTEGTPAGKGRRSQSRTGCRNRQGRQTNRNLPHHDAHLRCSEHPSLSNQTRPFLKGCSRAAQSRGMSRNQKGRLVPALALA